MHTPPLATNVLTSPTMLIYHTHMLIACTVQSQTVYHTLHAELSQNNYVEMVLNWWQSTKLLYTGPSWLPLAGQRQYTHAQSKRKLPFLKYLLIQHCWHNTKMESTPLANEAIICGTWGWSGCSSVPQKPTRVYARPTTRGEGLQLFV